MRRAVLLPMMLLLSGFAFSATPTTWIVDANGGPGVDFLDIPPAVSAAAPGDRVIVRSGQYSDTVIDKNLELVADTGHFPVLPGHDNVINGLPAGGRMVLSGFAILALTVQDCQGTVTIDGCTFGEWGLQASLYIENCNLVHVSRCQAFAPNIHLYTLHAEAVFVGGSTAIFSECVLEGGDGEDASWDDGYFGTPGLEAENSTIFFLASSARGGDGGNSLGTGPYSYGGSGAEGLDLYNCELELFGLPHHVIRGGEGGYGYAGDGNSAHAVTIWPGTVVHSGVRFESWYKLFPISGNSVKMDPAVPVITLSGSGEVGTELQTALYGLQGSDYAIFYSNAPSCISTAHLYTQLLINPCILILMSLGTIPPEGYISLNLTVPNDPQLRGKTAYFQAYLITGSGQAYLSTSAGFVIR